MVFITFLYIIYHAAWKKGGKELQMKGAAVKRSRKSFRFQDIICSNIKLNSSLSVWHKMILPTSTQE